MVESTYVDTAFEYLNTQIQPHLLSLLVDLRDSNGYQFGTPIMNHGLRMNANNKQRAFSFIEIIDNISISIKIEIDNDIERIKFRARSSDTNRDAFVVICKLENVTIDYIASFIKVAVNHFS